MILRKIACTLNLHTPSLGRPSMHLPSHFFVVMNAESFSSICREKKLALSMLHRKKKLSMKIFNSGFWYHHKLGGTLPFSHYEVNLGLFSLGFCTHNIRELTAS